MAKKTTAAAKTETTSTRSPKAGRPPAKTAGKKQVARRARRATVAVKKGTTMLQTDAGTQVTWGANQKRPQKT